MTNRELKAEIETLSAQLGVSVETERLGRDGLTKLVESLRQQVDARAVEPPGLAAPAATGEQVEPAPAEPVPPLTGGATKRVPPVAAVQATPPDVEVGTSAPDEAAVPAEASAPPPEPPAPAAKPDRSGSTAARYRVAPGCVIYTARGKLGAYRRISAHDLPGGQTMLDDLVRDGQVEKV